MSLRGRDNKRKVAWRGGHRNVKKFHGTKGHSGEEPYRNEGTSRWDEYPRPNEDGSNFYQHSNYAWTSKQYNMHHKANRNPNFQQMFDYPDRPPLLPDPPRDRGQEVVSVIETERMEKVLATKKRIEEALASKSSHFNSQEINFQDSLKDSNKDKTNDKNVPITSSELILTNSDFKEIGSVAPGLVAEGEPEPNDLMLNTMPCSTQRRSFDNTSQNILPPLNPAPSNSKMPKVGGWSFSGVNEIVTTGSAHINPVRAGRERYFKESRETILGNVDPTNEEEVVDPSIHRASTSTQKTQPRNDFSRVGRLYQSFLRSRLYGFTLKLRDKTQKLSGPNPLLDKSVLDNVDIQKDKILELQMPQPIQVKTEGGGSGNIPDEIVAEEANEFCKEFSYLLTHPNYLISPENLEKLGLGHLTDLNKLVDERRNVVNRTDNLSENWDSVLRVRSMNALNSISENDIAFSQMANSALNNASANTYNPSISSLSQGNNNSSAGSYQMKRSSNPASTTIPTLRGGHSSPSQPGSAAQSLLVPNGSETTGGQMSIASVVEKAVGQLFKSSNINSQSLNTNLQSMIRGNISQSVMGESRNETPSPSPSQSQPNSSGANQMQDVSSKILRLFLVDKQIEELMLEKMKIYTELLSSKEISSSLFNSWAQDQIQQGNVMSVVANSSNTVPELSRLLNSSTQSSRSFINNSFQEIVSELASLKKETADPIPTKLQNTNAVSSAPGDLEPSDTNCSTPISKSVESNKPKLSVRKDLIDPQLYVPIVNDNPFSFYNQSGEISSQNPESTFNAQEDDTSTNTSKQKKKSKKKQQALDIVDLVGDTTDDERCSVSLDGTVSSAGTDMFAPEDPRLAVGNIAVGNIAAANSNTKQLSKKQLTYNIKFELNNNTPTCVTIFKRALLVGCKEGILHVFQAFSGERRITSKIHMESIMCMHVSLKLVVTGSADSTISVFSLKDQIVLQTLQTNSPVQCFDIQSGGRKLYVGTKTGLLLCYGITKIDKNGKLNMSLEPSQPTIKLTDCSILDLKVTQEYSLEVLIVASRGEQITVREALTGRVLRCFEWCDTVYCLQLYKKSPLVYCGTNLRSVRVANFMTGETVHDCQVGRAVAQILFDSPVMFATCNDGKLYIYDVEDNKLLTTIKVPKGVLITLSTAKKKAIFAVDKDAVQCIPYPKKVITHLSRKRKLRKKKLTQLKQK